MIAPIRIVVLTGLLLGLGLSNGSSQTAAEWFRRGGEAYHSRDFGAAVKAFRESIAQAPGTSALQNLGLAEWQTGNIGEAVLAWERAKWLDPSNRAATANLEFARKNAQLPSPDLTWYEVPSCWISANVWAWTASLALWFTVGVLLVPGVLRKSRTTLQQALIAAGLVALLISLPVQVGVWTRARLGFVTGKNVGLRLTPTRDAETVIQLAPGEPIRWIRTRGDYFFVRTSHGAGWLERNDLGLVCPR